MMQATSSGFVFERRGSTVVLVSCPTRLQPLAELEYLREIEPGSRGRVVTVNRVSEGGRAVDVVGIEEPTGTRLVKFDVGPAFVEQLRVVYEALGVLLYALAGVTALGTLGYVVSRLMG
jgi:hypothetical protein